MIYEPEVWEQAEYDDENPDEYAQSPVMRHRENVWAQFP